MGAFAQLIRQSGQPVSLFAGDFPDAIRLARLASPASRIEPHLLRSLRTALLPDVDVSTEADLWFSPLVESRGANSIVLNAEIAELLQLELSRDQTLLERVAALLRSAHGHLPPILRLEEEVTLLALQSGDGPSAAIDALLSSALRAIAEDREHAGEIARWVLRAWPRLPPIARETRSGAALFLDAFTRFGMRASAAPINASASLKDIQWILGRHPVERSVSLGVHLRDGSVGFDEPVGDTVLSLPDTAPLLVEIRWETEGTEQSRLLEVSPGTGVELGSDVTHALILTLDGSVYELSYDAPATHVAPDAVATKTRRALLIGIDAYEQEHMTRLEGCVNDVAVMEDLLANRYGFARENIRVLADDQATRESILNEFDLLVSSVGPDDEVVVYFAGHGSLMTDREGDEPSGYDSTVVPADSAGWRGNNRDITDDEIRTRLVTPVSDYAAGLTLILDCSQTGPPNRDEFGERHRGVLPDTRDVSELPPSPIADMAKLRMMESGPSGWLPLSDKVLIIAACREGATASEYRPPEANGELVHGALTYCLAQALGNATSGMTYRDVFQRAATRAYALNRQLPQMQGPGDRQIFGVSTPDPRRTVVIARSGSTVELDAGAALGMTVGSRFDIHAEGTEQPDRSAALGVVEITQVRAVNSTAHIVDESSDGVIVPDTCAFESEHSFGRFVLDVHVVAGPEQESFAVELRERLRGSRLIREVDAGAPALTRMYALPPRTTVLPSDPVPQLVPDRAVWAAVGIDGALAFPVVPISGTDIVVSYLEQLARHRNALQLENPDPGSQLRDKFDLELLRRTPDGSWATAVGNDASGMVVFYEGDPIAFRVRSLQRNDEAAAYVNLIDFGITGSIEVIYPTDGTVEKLLPGMFFALGTAEHHELHVRFPDGSSNAPWMDNDEAIETIKLIVTSEPLDVRSLIPSGIRGHWEPDATDSSAISLWETALRGSSNGAIVRAPVKRDDWTTVTKSFVLRRRETVVPSNHVSLPLQLTEKGFYATTIDQEFYLRGSRLYLAVSSAAPSADIVQTAPRLMKISSADRIEELVKNALPGLQMQYVQNPPSALPVRLDYQYFELDLRGEEWDAIKVARNLSAYVPAALPDAKLELIILLP